MNKKLTKKETKEETKEAVLDRMLNRHRCPRCHKLVLFEDDTWCNDCTYQQYHDAVIVSFMAQRDEITRELTTVPKTIVERVSGLGRREE